MLHQLDQSLEDFLRTEVPLSRGDVDIVFDPPDNEWRTGLTKPTLNLFLWDIRASADESHAGRRYEERRGRRVFTEPDPRMAFRYLVTAWTNEVIDEHRLLGQVLTTVLPHRRLAEPYLSGSLAERQPPPNLKIARADSKDFAEFWSALDGKLKPGLDLQVTASIAGAADRDAGPPTEDVSFRVADRQEPARVSEQRVIAGEVADPEAIGAAVWSPRGATIVDEHGRFSVVAFPGDEIIIETRDRKRVTVGDGEKIRVE